ncbi:MAG: hypothetical protein WCO03_02085 [bacterium]
MRIFQHIFRVLRVVSHFSQTSVARSVVCVSFSVICLIFATYSLTLAAFNPQINYQALLSSDTGAAASNGNYNVRFFFYTTSTGGTPIWTEDYTANNNQVSVEAGEFSVLLGSHTSLAGVDFNQPLFLSVEVGGTTTVPVWDGEMSPRKQLGAVPAAFEARHASTSNEALLFSGLATTSFLRSDVANATGTINHLNSISASTSALSISGLTFGSVPFAGSDGLISQNNSNFYWDNVNYR